MKFTTRQYSNLKAKHQKVFALKLSELKKIKSSLHSINLAKDNNKLLLKGEGLHWFIVSQLQKLHHLSLLESSKNKSSFSATDDLIFEGWNQSEFAFHFLSSLNKGVSLNRAHKECLKKFDQHLEELLKRHLLLEKTKIKSYRPQIALGDISSKTGMKEMLNCIFYIDEKKIKLFGENLAVLKNQSLRIEHALKVIKRHSRSSWERFSAFTEVIVPIKQKEFVSYSEQILPGYSMINLFDRDFVDLMDDLIHENGHHHLNYYLNQKQLIKEPIDEIYYSPWRRTLRPLRGIYHAYFTFYWAFELFRDLSKAEELDSIWYLFNKDEKEKIYWRTVEEFYMLSYTFHDLQWAKRKNLISSEGWKLIEQQQNEIEKSRAFISQLEKKIKKHKNELKDLKRTLQDSRKQFLLS